MELEFLNRSVFATRFSQETIDFSTGSTFYIAYLDVVPSANVKSIKAGKRKLICENKFI